MIGDLLMVVDIAKSLLVWVVMTVVQILKQHLWMTDTER